jgi:ascorbate-specific PTS system EIIC-type component UlaA
MDPQEHRDGGLGGEDPSQWHGDPPIGSRLRVGALLFLPLFVPCLAAFFAHAYFGVTGDHRGDLIGSLAAAAALAAVFTALFAALHVVLSPLQWRLRRWVHGDE